VEQGPHAGELQQLVLAHQILPQLRHSLFRGRANPTQGPGANSSLFSSKPIFDLANNQQSLL
jgi:hypothetical protein